MRGGSVLVLAFVASVGHGRRLNSASDYTHSSSRQEDQERLGLMDKGLNSRSDISKSRRGMRTERPRNPLEALARILLGFEIPLEALSGLLLAVDPAAGFTSAAGVQSFAGDRRALSPFSRATQVSMKKGRPNMPQGMQLQKAKRREQQSIKPTLPEDGTPLYVLYVRSGPQTPWYPISQMQGDGQTKNLVNAWLVAPIGKDFLRKRIEGGMAKSIFETERRLSDMAVQLYPMLKPNKKKLMWGFKVLSKEIAIKEDSGELPKQKIVTANREMIKDTQGWVKGAQEGIIKFSKGPAEWFKNKDKEK